MPDDGAPTIAEARARLTRLQAERHEVLAAGGDPGSRYMRHVEAAIASARAEYVTRAVTEIAAFRRELTGAQLG